MSLIQEKIKKFLWTINSKILQNNKNIPDYAILQKFPKLIVAFATNKLDAKELFVYLQNTFYYGEKHKSKLKMLPKDLEKLSLQELISNFANNASTCAFLRKLTREKLRNYDNIGLNNKNLWFIASDAKYFMDQNPTYYKTLKETLGQSPNFFSHIIELDLKRTLPPNPDEEHYKIQGKCRHILTAYARRNPDLGYCQGLNFIAWEICRREFTEEEAFWFLVALIENVLPLDYYSSLEGILVDQRIFTCLIETNLPEIAKKLQDCNLDCSAFSIPWFVCLYSRNLSPKLFEVVLDNLIVQGSVALFKIGLTVLKLMEPQILKAVDFPHLLKTIEERSKKLNDPLKFQELINEIYLSKKTIGLARVMFCNLIEEENFKNNLKHNKFGQKNLKHSYEKLHESKSKCNPSELTCLTFIEFNKIAKKNYIHFVYRQSPKLLAIFPDYVLDPAKKKDDHNGIHFKGNHLHQHHIQNYIHNHEIPEEDKLLLGRHVHMCQQDNKKPGRDKLAEKPAKKTTFIPLPAEANLQSYIAQSVKESRDSTEISPVNRKVSAKYPLNFTNSIELRSRNSRNHSSAMSPASFDMMGNSAEKNDNEFSFICEEGLSDFSAFLAPFGERKNQTQQKTSFQSEHSVIYLDDCESMKSEENLEEMYDNFDPENYNPRESILLLKNRKVYNNINREVLDKYFADIEHSESFDFVNKLFAHDIVKK